MLKSRIEQLGRVCTRTSNWDTGIYEKPNTTWMGHNPGKSRSSQWEQQSGQQQIVCCGRLGMTHMARSVQPVSQHTVYWQWLCFDWQPAPRFWGLWTVKSFKYEGQIQILIHFTEAAATGLTAEGLNWWVRLLVLKYLPSLLQHKLILKSWCQPAITAWAPQRFTREDTAHITLIIKRREWNRMKLRKVGLTWIELDWIEWNGSGLAWTVPNKEPGEVIVL